MRSFLVFFALTGATLAANAMQDDRLDSQSLKRLVHQDCGSCHGMTLKGGLGPDIRSKTISHYTPESLKAVILDGVPGTPMPPWRPLITDEEAEWIARYLLDGGAS